MFPKQFDTEQIKSISKSGGRKLCVNFMNNNEGLALLNVYAPTKDNNLLSH